MKVEEFQEGELPFEADREPALSRWQFTFLYLVSFLSFSEMPLVWTYMYTTAQSEDLDPEFSASDFKAPMAGFGYGLPLARLVSQTEES